MQTSEDFIVDALIAFDDKKPRRASKDKKRNKKDKKDKKSKKQVRRQKKHAENRKTVKPSHAQSQSGQASHVSSYADSGVGRPGGSLPADSSRDSVRDDSLNEHEE